MDNDIKEAAEIIALAIDRLRVSVDTLDSTIEGIAETAIANSAGEQIIQAMRDGLQDVAEVIRQHD